MLSCTRATKEALRFWGCGQFLPFVIKRILGIKRIFPCSFGNKIDIVKHVKASGGLLSECIVGSPE